MKNPILPIVHKIEIGLNRRLTDKEYDEFLRQIESEITMIQLTDWVSNLPKEIVDGIKNL